MINNAIKLTITFLSSIILIFSCTKEDEPVQMGKEEAVELITVTSQLMDHTIVQLEQTEGVLLLSRFVTLNESTVVSKFISNSLFGFNNPVIVKPRTKNVSNQFETPFGDFGTYTWNFSLNTWDFEATPSDKIIYLFPVDDTDNENTGNLTIEQFEQIDELNGFVNQFLLTLKNDLMVVLSIDYSAELTNSSIDKVTISINLNPFTIHTNQQFTEKEGGSFIESSITFKNQGVTLMSSILEIQTVDEVLISPDNTNELTDVKINHVLGYVQMGSLKATLDLLLLDFQNEQELTALEYETLANKNLRVKLYEYPSGENAAFIKWYFNSQNNEIEPFLVFSDESEELAMDFLPQNLLEMLEDNTSEEEL